MPKLIGILLVLDLEDEEVILRGDKSRQVKMSRTPFEQLLDKAAAKVGLYPVIPTKKSASKKSKKAVANKKSASKSRSQTSKH